MGAQLIVAVSSCTCLVTSLDHLWVSLARQLIGRTTMAFPPIHRNALGCYLVLYIVTGTCKLNLLAMLYDSQSIHLASKPLPYPLVPFPGPI